MTKIRAGDLRVVGPLAFATPDPCAVVVNLYLCSNLAEHDVVDEQSVCATAVDADAQRLHLLEIGGDSGQVDVPFVPLVKLNAVGCTAHDLCAIDFDEEEAWGVVRIAKETDAQPLDAGSGPVLGRIERTRGLGSIAVRCAAVEERHGLTGPRDGLLGKRIGLIAYAGTVLAVIVAVHPYVEDCDWILRIIRIILVEIVNDQGFGGGEVPDGANPNVVTGDLFDLPGIGLTQPQIEFADVQAAIAGGGAVGRFRFPGIDGDRQEALFTPAPLLGTRASVAVCRQPDVLRQHTAQVNSGVVAVAGHGRALRELEIPQRLPISTIRGILDRHILQPCAENRLKF